MKTILTRIYIPLSLALISGFELQAQPNEKTTNHPSKMAIENSNKRIITSHGTPSSELLDSLGIVGEEPISKISVSFRDAGAACRSLQISKLLGHPIKGKERVTLRIGEVVEVPALSELEINEIAVALGEKLLQTLTKEQVNGLLLAEISHLKEFYGTPYSIAAIPKAARKKSDAESKDVEGISGLNRQLKGIVTKSYSIWINRASSEHPEEIGGILVGERYDLFEIKEK